MPIRLRNDLYRVGWGVKLYSLTHYAMPAIESAVVGNVNRIVMLMYGFNSLGTTACLAGSQR